MAKKLIAVILVVTCFFSCFSILSFAFSEAAQSEPSTEFLQSEESENERFSLLDLITQFRQKIAAIVRIGDSVIVEVGVERNENDQFFSPYIEILGYPLQKIIHFFQNIKEYF